MLRIKLFTSLYGISLIMTDDYISPDEIGNLEIIIVLETNCKTSIIVHRMSKAAFSNPLLWLTSNKLGGRTSVQRT